MSNSNQVPGIAVVGCGDWGRHHVRNYHALGALRAICDADVGTARSQEAAYGVPARGFEDLLTDPEIEGVALCTPDKLHSVMTGEALDAGKHVFVEKPIAFTSEETRTLSEKAAATKRVLMTGHILQYHPAFRRLSELIMGGIIGKARHITAERRNFGKFGNGRHILWDLAPHDISMALALFDEMPSNVRAVGCAVLRSGVADSVTIEMEFPSGRTAEIGCSSIYAEKRHRLTVVGEQAFAVFDDTAPWHEKVALYSHAVDWSPTGPKARRGGCEFVAVDEGEPLQLECRHFLDCIVNGHRPVTDGAEGGRVVDVLIAAEQSLEMNAPVRLAG